MNSKTGITAGYKKIGKYLQKQGGTPFPTKTQAERTYRELSITFNPRKSDRKLRRVNPLYKNAKHYSQVK